MPLPVRVWGENSHKNGTSGIALSLVAPVVQPVVQPAVTAGLELFALGCLSLLVGGSVIALLQRFGIMEIQACRFRYNMLSNELAGQDETIRFTFQTLIDIVSLEKSLLSATFSSEEREYFFEISREKGLTTSEIYEKLNELQAQMQELSRIVIRVEEIAKSIDDFSQETSYGNEENDIRVLTEKVKRSQEQLKVIGDKSLEVLPLVFEFLTRLVGSFWDFMPPKLKNQFEVLAYSLYESKVRGKKLKPQPRNGLESRIFDSYQGSLEFIETIVRLTDRKSPELLNLGAAEEKAIERLSNEQETEWIDLSEDDLQDMTPEEIRQYMEERGYS